MEAKRQKTIHEGYKVCSTIEFVNENKVELDHKKGLIFKPSICNQKINHLKKDNKRKVFIYNNSLWKLSVLSKNSLIGLKKQIKCLKEIESLPFIPKHYSIEINEESKSPVPLDLQTLSTICDKQLSKYVLVQEIEYIKGFDLKNYTQLEKYFQNPLWTSLWLKKALDKTTSQQGDCLINTNEQEIEELKKWKPKLLLCQMILQQLETLWLKGWSHGDIKPGNILFSPSLLSTYWIDFEFCKNFKENDSNPDYFKGSIFWVPPSSLSSIHQPMISDEFSCKKKDLWGIISTMYWIFTGRYLIPCLNSESQEQYIQRLKQIKNFTLKSTGYKPIDDSFSEIFPLLEEAKNISEIESLFEKTKSFLYRLCN